MVASGQWVDPTGERYYAWELIASDQTPMKASFPLHRYQPGKGWAASHHCRILPIPRSGMCEARDFR